MTLATSTCNFATTTKPEQAHRSATYLLLAPALIAMIGLIFAPTAAIFLLAFTNWKFGSTHASFVGMGNFLALSTDAMFWKAIQNTLLYSLMVIPGTLILGLLVALQVASLRRFQALYQALHFLPFMAT